MPACGASAADMASGEFRAGTSPPDDLNGPRVYQDHLARVLVGRR